MKKYFKYIAVLIILTLAIMNKLSADEVGGSWTSDENVNNSWTFRCDYTLALKEDETPIKLRALIYTKFEKATDFYGNLFYLLNNDTQLYDIISFGSLENSDGTSKPIYVYDNYHYLYINRNNIFFTLSTNDNYSCPKITSTEIHSSDITGYKLYFGSNNELGEDNNGNQLKHFEGTLSINSRLSNEEKEEVRGRILEITKQCNLRFKESNRFPQFHLLLMSNNLIYIAVETDNDEVTQIYDPFNETEFKHNHNTYKFRYEDYDFFRNMLKSTDCKLDSPIGIGISEYDPSKMWKATYTISTIDYLKSQGYEIMTSDSSLNISAFDKYVDTCKNMLGTKLVGYLQTGYTIIKIATIVIVIVLAMLDFAQNVLSGKEEALKIVMKWGKRLVIVIIILLLPTFIDLIGSLFGYPDIVCGIK